MVDDVLVRDPANLHAHYCRGIILEYLGQMAQAHEDFVFVTEHDPSDGHAWFKVGSTLCDPDNPDRPAGPDQAKQLIEIYTKALERNPYLVNALFKLQAAYGWAGDREKQKELLERWRNLNPKSNPVGSGDLAETFYGEMGRYARIIDPILAFKSVEEASPKLGVESVKSRTFQLPQGHRWVSRADFKGPLAVVGRARDRCGAAVATFDADGDGKLDLYLCAGIIGPKGVRDALLLNQGEGRFEDSTAAFGLPDDRASLGVAAGDFDADRRIDLFVTGVGSNRLYRNLGKKFEDVTQSAGLIAPPTLSLTARWLDLDQDGDLDLYVINYTDLDHADLAFTETAPPGLTNAVYRNDGKPAPIQGRPQDNWAPLAVAPEDLPAIDGLSTAFIPWPEAEALRGGNTPHTAVAALDLDDDRDIDLVLSAAGAPPIAVLNDRLGRFHAAGMKTMASSETVTGLLVTDLDKDGRSDLVAVEAKGRVAAWRNTTHRSSASREITWELWPCNAREWRCAVTADPDLDTWPDLLGIDSHGLSVFARNEGRRLVQGMGLFSRDERDEDHRALGFALADLEGDPLPELCIPLESQQPMLLELRPAGVNRHWLGLDFTGRWKTSFDHMRTNPHGLGVRVELEGQGLNVLYDHTTPEAGLAQSVGPVVLGLDTDPSAALLRLRWPDGTMQCELNLPSDQVFKVVEHNRKTGSCPILFTWNGERFACVGDFLGGGGLGYLVAPGLYGQPDRDEAIAIASEQLRDVGGTYRLSITEPMDEVAYLDRLVLEVVDCPPGVSAAPDERFAPQGPRPTGEIIAWRTAIEPVRATDLDGRDVTDQLRVWDRQTVDGFRRLRGWIGYAEEHGIMLDFGDRLSRFGPNDALVLCLAGWVEYPYSQTNYAAATAGVELRAPTIERLRDDGTWQMIEPNAGYPAGLPRLTTLDLGGRLIGSHCVLRLRTNMQCYWDQAFLAVRDATLASE